MNSIHHSSLSALLRRCALAIALCQPLASFAPGHELPKPLRQALLDSSNQDRFAFLGEVEQTDMDLFHRSFFGNGFRNWAAAQREPFGASLNRKHNVVGALGEIYLNVHMRQWLKLHPQSQFIHAFEYDAKNPQGSRADGLVVRTTDDGLVVEKILESKMGGATYSRAQLYGMIATWKVVGLTLPDGTHYPPDKILIPQDNGALPLSTFHFTHGIYRDSEEYSPEDIQQLKRLERNVMLFASRGSVGPFDGEIIYTPFDDADLYRLLDRYLAYGWLQDPSPEEVDALLANPRRAHQQHPKPPPISAVFNNQPMVTKQTAPPPLPKGAMRTPELDAELIEYIKTHLEFPSSAKNKKLASYLSAVGGRMYVFANLLDDTTREQMMAFGRGPAVGPMEHWLIATNPDANRDLYANVKTLFEKHFGCSARLQRLGLD